MYKLNKFCLTFFQINNSWIGKAFGYIIFFHWNFIVLRFPEVKENQELTQTTYTHKWRDALPTYLFLMTNN